MLILITLDLARVWLSFEIIMTAGRTVVLVFISLFGGPQWDRLTIVVSGGPW